MVDTEIQKKTKETLPIQPVAVYVLTFLQKKCTHIFDGEMTICNVKLHFYLFWFFLHVHESAFSELMKTFFAFKQHACDQL